MGAYASPESPSQPAFLPSRQLQGKKPALRAMLGNPHEHQGWQVSLDLGKTLTRAYVIMQALCKSQKFVPLNCT